VTPAADEGKDGEALIRGLKAKRFADRIPAAQARE
jgi:hypothetical protein